jgi:hypothetical protein
LLDWFFDAEGGGSTTATSANVHQSAQHRVPEDCVKSNKVQVAFKYKFICYNVCCRSFHVSIPSIRNVTLKNGKINLSGTEA